MSNKKLKKFPKFKNDDEERTFWATQDSAEYLDWSKAKKLRFTRPSAFPNTWKKKFRADILSPATLMENLASRDIQ